MEQTYNEDLKQIDMTDLDFTDINCRKDFIKNNEGAFLGKNCDGETVVVECTKGECMLVKTIHATKPKWFEVVEYDSHGLQESVSYEPAR